MPVLADAAKLAATDVSSAQLHQTLYRVRPCLHTSPPHPSPLLLFLVLHPTLLLLLSLPSAVPTTDLLFRQLFDTSGSSTYTYLVADPVTKEALLIDPVLEQVGICSSWGCGGLLWT